MLGHELRNPRAPILTALQLQRMRGVDGADRERQIIERQVKHLVGLVEDLLDVSRITRGKIQLRRAPVEIAEVVAKAVETASPLLEQKGHVLKLDVPRHGLTVDGDANRLAQAVANLLNNAAKYTEKPGQITVSAVVDGGEVILRVRDTGMGIAPEMLPRIFDLFVQEGQALDRSQGGLGLGLAIVRSLVHLHGGRVTAHSDGQGFGAEFVVHLPHVAADVAADPLESDASTATAPAAAAMRVLVVDDNEDGAAMLGELLRMHGYEVRTAHDGPSALELAEAFTPDLALLDIGLPVMDGCEVARRFRSTP